MKAFQALQKPRTTRLVLVSVFLLLSLCYTRKESNLPFKIKWIWHEQPVQYILSPVTYTGLPWPYWASGGFQVAGTARPDAAFLGCDKMACVFDLPWQQRLFFHYYNVVLNLVFWYLIAWFSIFVFAKLRKRAHGAVG